MENQMSISKYSLCMGVTIGLILSAVSILNYIPFMSGVAGMVCFVTLIFATIFAVKRFKDKYRNGNIGSGSIFKLSLGIFTYIGIISAIFYYIIIGYFPSENEIKTIETFSEIYSENNIDISTDQLWTILPIISASVMLIAHIILGLILGGIYAATMKSEEDF